MFVLVATDGFPFPSVHAEPSIHVREMFTWLVDVKLHTSQKTMLNIPQLDSVFREKIVTML